MLKSLETKIAGLVEGAFGRAFRSELRPVEIARKLAREMDEHRTPSVSRTYVPNEYSVYVSRGRPRAVRRLGERAGQGAGGLPARARAAGAPRAAVAPGGGVPHRRAPVAGRVRDPGATGARSRWSAGRARAGRRRPHDDLQRRAPARRRPCRRREGTGGVRGPAPGGGRERGRDGPQPRLRHRPGGRQRLTPPRRDPSRRRRLGAGGPGLHQRGVARRAAREGRKRRWAAASGSSWAPPRCASSWSRNLLDPVSVALKFGFLLVLYLFLAWVARSALKDLRRRGRG